MAITTLKRSSTPTFDVKDTDVSDTHGSSILFCELCVLLSASIFIGLEINWPALSSSGSPFVEKSCEKHAFPPQL